VKAVRKEEPVLEQAVDTAAAVEASRKTEEMNQKK
jgi:hypothetical protein